MSVRAHSQCARGWWTQSTRWLRQEVTWNRRLPCLSSSCSLASAGLLCHRLAARAASPGGRAAAVSRRRRLGDALAWWPSTTTTATTGTGRRVASGLLRQLAAGARRRRPLNGTPGHTPSRLARYAPSIFAGGSAASTGPVWCTCRRSTSSAAVRAHPVPGRRTAARFAGQTVGLGAGASAQAGC